MQLDPVHDLQAVFRKILNVMSRPGTVLDLSREAGLLDLELPLNKGLMLVALALLDAETSFALSSGDSYLQSKAISQMTYAKTAVLGEADFIFVPSGADAAKAIAAAKSGTLVDPHLGATIVIEVPSVDEKGVLQLSGPGIESTARFGVGLDHGWLAARGAKNIEFPLGVDLIFVDERLHLCALPRTTLVRQEA